VQSEPKLSFSLRKESNLTNGTPCPKRYIKVKINFSIEQATKAQRGSRGIALLFL
jgi:hypothetical protein